MTAQHQTKNSLQLIRNRRTSIAAGLLLVALAYVAIPQLGFFDANWRTLFHSDWRLFAASVACLLLSFAAASSIYVLLSPRRLSFAATYLVQIAGAFAGKVLPAGLGSISVNYLYLRKQGLRQAVAATVIATNNLLGYVGHGLWLLIVWVLAGHGQLMSRPVNLNHWVILAIGVGVVVLLGVLYSFRRRLRTVIRDVLMQLRAYRKQPLRLASALLASMVLTACNIAIVWLSAQALDVSLGVLAAAIALTTGILAQTVTPTPGGLGGVEAGLVGGLVLNGVPLEAAVTVTILFRFVTYWLPLLFGGLALLVAVRRQII